MQQYYFLFALAFIWTLFASIQDLRKREVANWLNFSLIIFSLAYRAFYSLSIQDKNFFLFGLSGFAIFFVMANILYYTRAFAGGDAKLLMGFGTILPYQSYSDLVSLSLLFIFLLFFIGAIYSLVYSVFIATKNKKQFKKEFLKRFKKTRKLQMLSTIIFLLLLIAKPFYPFSIVFPIFFLIPIVYIYTKALDKCMIKLYPPSKLTEGDWLENSVKVHSHLIKKSVHGLSLEEIKLLRKYNKSVLIKEGIPFVPAFLIALIIMVCAFLVLQISPEFLFSLF